MPDTVFPLNSGGDLLFTSGPYPGKELFRFRAKDGAMVVGGGASVHGADGSIAGPQFTKGADIVSANTVAPLLGVHKVTAANLIKTITPPAWLQAGMSITFLPAAAYTTDATGNIQKASTAVAGLAMTFTWDGTKWWPSY